MNVVRATDVIDRPETFHFLHERLAFFAVEDPVDRFGKEADPVTSKMHVRLFARQEEKAALGKALAFLVHDAELL